MMYSIPFVGMMLATKQRRLKLQQDVSMALLEMDLADDLKTAFNDWIKYMENPERCDVISTAIENILERDFESLDQRLKEIYKLKDMLRTQSHWLVGGDGWAYVFLIFVVSEILITFFGIKL